MGMCSRRLNKGVPLWTNVEAMSRRHRSSLSHTHVQSKLQRFTGKGRCKHPHPASSPLPPLRGSSITDCKSVSAPTCNTFLKHSYSCTWLPRSATCLLSIGPLPKQFIGSPNARSYLV